MPNIDGRSEHRVAKVGGVTRAPHRVTRDRVHWLARQAVGEVLDVGSADGTVSLLCARRGLRTLGVDIDDASIAHATAMGDQEPDQVRDLVSFRVADAAELDVPDAAFDCVLMGDVIDQCDAAAQILTEGVRVVRARGLVVLTTPLGYVPGRQVTFYLASLLELIGRQVTVESLDIVDDHFRVVARPGSMSVNDRLRLVSDLQPTFEAALLRAQRAAHRERSVTQGRLRHAEVRLQEEEYRTQYANWQFRSLKNRRWWRLGEAIGEVRKQRPNLASLPRNVALALRPAPSPQRPAPLPRQRTAEHHDGLADAGTKESGTSSHFSTVELPKAVDLPDGPLARPGLKVAVILDVFSATAFGYEWNQVQPGPDDWQEVLERELPDLLFVESAWQGNAGRWRYTMSASGAPKQPLRDLVAWCRRQGIPSVFWNKEDPPHFNRFIETAKIFDHVFTVDSDCIPGYREALGHSRVGLLPFAAQPRIHNPVSVAGGRRYDVAFAGTYHTGKYPERVAQMETVVSPAREFGLHIFSRISDDPKFRFPTEYSDHIVGSLPYERMLATYKAYKVFLNVNSVTGSPTMCARRVFELSACSTPVISGHSRALEDVFGDLIRLSRWRQDTTEALKDLLEDDDLRDRQGHLAMREVFAKHTFGHRVDTVLDALGMRTERATPTVSVILSTNRAEQLDHAIAQVARQSHRPLELVVVLHGLDIDAEAVEDRARAAGVTDVVVRHADASLTLGSCLNLGIEAADGRYLAKMDDDNIYGEHYVSDLLHAFSYTRAGIVGKGAHYVSLQRSGVTILRFSHLEHTASKLVQGGTILADAEVLRQLRFADLPSGVDTDLLRRARTQDVGIYSADRFNFISVRRSDPNSHTWKITDEELMRNSQTVLAGEPTKQVLF